MAKFKVGDKVMKPKGYSFNGTVVSVFNTTSGETRVVAELDNNGMLHIFSEGQLEVRENIYSGDVFEKLTKVDWGTYWWHIDQDGFDIYLNCNDLHRGTSFGLCLYRGIDHSDREIKLVIQEGLMFLEDFLNKHKKNLDLFYETYTFAALDDLIALITEFKDSYELKYDDKTPPINPFK